MRIRRCPIVFHNVISASAICGPNEWHQTVKDLRNAILVNGLYGTGPVIFQAAKQNKSDTEAEYQFYIPVNRPILMPDNEQYSYTELWKYEDGLVLRHADLEDDIEESYEVLRACAEANQVQLQEPFYNIYLDVYGDGIIDIFAPIIKGDSNDRFE